MKFCNQCGAQLRDEMKVCPTCGCDVTGLKIFPDKTSHTSDGTGRSDDTPAYGKSSGDLGNIYDGHQIQDGSIRDTVPKNDIRKNGFPDDVRHHNNMTDNKDGSKKKKIAIATAIAVVVLIVIVCAFFLGKRSSDTTDEPEISPTPTEELTPLPSPTIAPEKEIYDRADKLLEEGMYKDAADLFYSIKDFEDARDKYYQATYRFAKKKQSDGEYQKALDLYDKISGYKDSDTQIKECRYQMAVDYFNDGDYDSAKKIFKKLGEYKNTQSYLSQMSTDDFANKTVSIGNWKDISSSYTEGDGFTYRIKWTAIDDADGYQVSLSEGYEGGEDTTRKETTSKLYFDESFSDLDHFSVKVRAYKMVNGSKVYTSWSKKVTQKIEQPYT